MKKLFLTIATFCTITNTYAQLSLNATNNLNVGINLTTPRARLEVFRTGNQVFPNWGFYPSASRIGIAVTGSHSTVGDNYDAIGLAGFGENASATKNNIGVLATTGTSGGNNIGMYAYQNAAFTGKVYASYNDVTKSGTGTAYGSYNTVSSSGNTTQNNYGVYAKSNHTSTSGAPNTYGVYGEAFTSGPASLGIFSIGVVGDAHGLGVNYGLYGRANGGTSNVALYAEGNSILAGDVNVDQYTKLGIDAPAIKMKKFTGNTATTVGGYTTITHGLTANKILSVKVVIDLGVAGIVSENYTQTSGYQVGTSIDPTLIYIWNSPANSANILNKPFKVLITYEQ